MWHSVWYSMGDPLLILAYYSQVITLTKTTTTTTILVYKKDSLGYQIQTVYIEQGKYISENWRCECIDQDSRIEGNKFTKYLLETEYFYYTSLTQDSYFFLPR